MPKYRKVLNQSKIIQKMGKNYKKAHKDYSDLVLMITMGGFETAIAQVEVLRKEIARYHKGFLSADSHAQRLFLQKWNKKHSPYSDDPFQVLLDECERIQEGLITRENSRQVYDDQ